MARTGSGGNRGARKGSRPGPFGERRTSVREGGRPTGGRAGGRRCSRFARCRAGGFRNGRIADGASSGIRRTGPPGPARRQVGTGGGRRTVRRRWAATVPPGPPGRARPFRSYGCGDRAARRAGRLTANPDISSGEGPRPRALGFRSDLPGRRGGRQSDDDAPQLPESRLLSGPGRLSPAPVNGRRPHRSPAGPVPGRRWRRAGWEGPPAYSRWWRRKSRATPGVRRCECDPDLGVGGASRCRSAQCRACVGKTADGSAAPVAGRVDLVAYPLWSRPPCEAGHSISSLIGVETITERGGVRGSGGACPGVAGRVRPSGFGGRVALCR